MKRKQTPSFFVVEQFKIAGVKPINKSYYTSEFVDEEESEVYSRKVVPRNRQAFRIALKRLNSKYSSKKAGTRGYYNEKEAVFDGFAANFRSIGRYPERRRHQELSDRLLFDLQI